LPKEVGPKKTYHGGMNEKVGDIGVRIEGEDKERSEGGREYGEGG